MIAIKPAPAKAGGKTSRRIVAKKGGKAPLHIVSAFATRQRRVLGQLAVGEKSNEIVVSPRRLDMLAIEGAIDAIGCQRAIAAKIVDKKADYVLALKADQPRLHDDVALFVAEQKANGFEDTAISRHQTVDGDHGRIETRTTTVIEDIARLRVRHPWPGLKTIVADSTREIGAETEREIRLYISSLALAAEKLGPIIRSHWAIENSLHWVMDMAFRDDECRLRTDHAPAKFHHQAHGPEPDPNSPRQRLLPPPPQGRRLGRRLPRKPGHRMTRSPDSPWGSRPGPMSAYVMH